MKMLLNFLINLAELQQVSLIWKKNQSVVQYKTDRALSKKINLLECCATYPFHFDDAGAGYIDFNYQRKNKLHSVVLCDIHTYLITE